MTKKKTSVLLVLLIVSAVCFVGVAFLVATGKTQAFDEHIMRQIYAIRTPGMNTLMEAITHLGDWEAVVIIILLLLAYKKTDNAYGLPAASTALLTTVLKVIIKPIIARPRPDHAMFLVKQGGYSFPSGHSITSMGVYGILFLQILENMERSGKKTALLVLTAVMPFLISFSRIYVGVHYPTDVLAGWFGGIASICIVLLLKPVVQRKMKAINTSKQENKTI